VSKARLVITAVVVEGRSVREVSAAYRVARSWIYELLERYRSEGEAAFEPRSRRPRSQPTAIPAATVALIIRLRRQLTRQGLDAGAQTIAWHLVEQHQLTVSEATIWRILKRAGLITPEPQKKPKTACRSFAAELPNQMWQVDFTHYRLTRPDGTPGADAEILCFLDDHSRYAISVTCHQPVTGPVVVVVFRQAVADQGIPASVLSLNGMVFTTRFAGARAVNGLSALLRDLGVTQKHSKPNHPTTCGKVERFHQTPEEVILNVSSERVGSVDTSLVFPAIRTGGIRDPRNTARDVDDHWKRPVLDGRRLTLSAVSHSQRGWISAASALELLLINSATDAYP
jgi:transposase InsO family protein